MNELKVGNVVRLVSGSDNMTVQNIDEATGKVTTMWFSHDGKVWGNCNTAQFIEEMLEIVEE